MDILREIESLKIPHYSCEDYWYSCPKAEGGCAKENDGECDCSAEGHNAKVDEIIRELTVRGFKATNRRKGK